jgi:hypothetical protein
MLMDATSNDDHEINPKTPARIILRSGRAVKGLLAAVYPDGGLTLEQPRTGIGPRLVHVDLREVAVLEW